MCEDRSVCLNEKYMCDVYRAFVRRAAARATREEWTETVSVLTPGRRRLMPLIN